MTLRNNITVTWTTVTPERKGLTCCVCGETFTVGSTIVEITVPGPPEVKHFTHTGECQQKKSVEIGDTPGF